MFRIGHVQATVDEILRYRHNGDVVLEGQARRTLAEILAQGIEHARSQSVREQLADALAAVDALDAVEVQS